jgi:hypothetical protein
MGKSAKSFIISAEDSNGQCRMLTNSLNFSNVTNSLFVFFCEKYGFILISYTINAPPHSLTKCRISKKNVNCEIVSTFWKEYFLPYTVVVFLSCLLQELSQQFEFGHKRYGWIDHNWEKSR